MAAAAAAVGQTPAEFLEALLDGDVKFQIPINARIPVKRAGKIEYEPLSVVRDDLARQADYSRRTAALADQRTQHELTVRQHAAVAARFAAEKAAFDAERKLHDEALGDPVKWAQYEQHMEAYRTNPMYRDMVDKARNAGVIEAENTAIHEHDQQVALYDVAQRVDNAIVQIAEEFQGVDPALVREAYAAALRLGEADLTEKSLRSFFEREAQRTKAVTGPIQTELAELKRQIAELTQQRQAEGHNANTARVLQRDQTGKFTAPTGGNGQSVTKPAPTPYTSSEAAQRQRAWVKGP